MIALPFQVVNGRAVTVPGGTDAEVMQCVGVVLSYPLEWRPEAPTFGVPNQAHEQGPVDLAPLEEALDRLEPRWEGALERGRTDLGGVLQRIRVTTGEEG